MQSMSVLPPDLSTCTYAYIATSQLQTENGYLREGEREAGEALAHRN